MDLDGKSALTTQPKDLLGAGLFAVVPVFEADDVVFAELVAGLHFDDLQRHAARILEAVPGAYRDEGGLVLRERQQLVAARDARGPRDHDPMLGAAVMHLQRERVPGVHYDALHLVAAAGVHALVVAPRPVDAVVAQMLGALRVG